MSPKIHLFPDPIFDVLVLYLMSLPDVSGEGARTLQEADVTQSVPQLTSLSGFYPIRDGIGTRTMNFSIFSKSLVSYHYSAFLFFLLLIHIIV